MRRTSCSHQQLSSPEEPWRLQRSHASSQQVGTSTHLCCLGNAPPPQLQETNLSSLLLQRAVQPQEGALSEIRRFLGGPGEWRTGAEPGGGKGWSWRRSHGRSGEDREEEDEEGEEDETRSHRRSSEEEEEVEDEEEQEE